MMLPGVPPPANPLASLPPEVYLIACKAAGERSGTVAGATTAPVAASGAPSADSMGAKAWNLLRMARLHLPVPPAFVLGTFYCLNPAARAGDAVRPLWQGGVRALERATGLRWKDNRRPLLVSVRSGAPVSMPGMMETLLDVGLCDASVPGLLRRTGNPRLVWDSYRRLVATYGDVVAGLPTSLFDAAAEALFGRRDPATLDFTELRALTHRFLAVYASAAGTPFPQDPDAQLDGAITAVFASWQSAKACEYRRANRIAETLGTAVAVQVMVFGNAGGRSGAGVGFTRDPRTGMPGLWVDFLFNAQGEDVVAGRRNAQGHAELASVLPAIWQTLTAAAGELERAFTDMQDIEFTVQDNQLFLLQTRTGKRSREATVRIALDLFDEQVIDRAVACARTAGLDRPALARSSLVTAAGVAPLPLASASAASNGIASGEIALDQERAKRRHAAGASVILVRHDAETSDIAALEVVAGLLTGRGARTSHAAVVARQLGIVCLVGCSALQIDAERRTITLQDITLQEGDLLSLDGNTGSIYSGTVTTAVAYPEDLLLRLEALRNPP